MNTLLHRDGDDNLDDFNHTADREITLGTTMILGIFFALAVLCAIFFGFGYQLGRKSIVSSTGSYPGQAPASANFAGFKPAAGSVVGSTPDKSSGQAVAVPYAPLAPPAAAPHPAQPAPEPPADATGDSPASAPTEAPTTSSAHPLPAPAAATSTAATTPELSGAIVQIAAVSHQEDADLLVTTLKRRGYNVAVHTEPQDKLLHVQVGPFASHKDADAMRQRLLADGFNAIVKDNK